MMQVIAEGSKQMVSSFPVLKLVHIKDRKASYREL